MKEITALSLVRTGEGLRLAYTYNETDATGRLTAIGRRGCCLVDDPAVQALAARLETLAARHLAGQTGGAYAERAV